MDKSTGNIETIIYPPAQTASLVVTALKEIEQNKVGLQSGIPDLDNVMSPFRPGELISVIGYTSWYKSGLMNFIAKHNIPLLDQERECIVKVTWEQSVEEDSISWVAADSGVGITTMARGLLDQEQWRLVMTSYKRRINTPLWIVGHSQQESAVSHRSRPRITMTDVTHACELISHGITPEDRQIKMIILDYLQRIRPDPSDGQNKREQMIEAVNKAKDLAITFGCPVLLGVQAGRQVLDRKYKLPRIDDGQETSNIEQSSDKAISLWYPIKTEEQGSLVDTYPVNNNLLILALLKQKLGSAPHTIYTFVQPDKNIISSMARNIPVGQEYLHE